MLHPNEVEISLPSVRELIAEQFPQWQSSSLKRLKSEGTTNVLYRIGDELIARFPRTPDAAEQIEKEWAWLPKLAGHLPFPIPTPVGRGLASEHYPLTWSICRWLPGEAFPAENAISQPEFAEDLANFVRCLQSIDGAKGPAPGSHNFHRGAPLQTRDEQTRAAIRSFKGTIDSAAAARVWDAALTASTDEEPAWIHGDLLPGNLLFDEGRLSAVIDFGGLGMGDRACDFMPAWNFFSAKSRPIFRRGLDASDEAWARGRGWALSQAVI